MDAITNNTSGSYSVKKVASATEQTVNRNGVSADNTYGSNGSRAAASSTGADGQSAVDQAAERNRQELVSERGRADSQDRRLENVVSMSKDGDTVQVDPRTEKIAARADEGAVTRREEMRQARIAEEEARRQREAEIRSQQIDSANEKEAAQVTSLAGYTSSQIEQLYQEGRISRQDYENEMAAKKAAIESAQSNNSAFSEEQARLNGTMTKAQLDAQSIGTAFSDSAQDPQAAAQRLDAMQRIQDQGDRNQANIQQQSINSNNEGRRTWDYQLQA